MIAWPIASLNAFAGHWFNWMVHMSWQVALFTGIVWFVAGLSRKGPANFRYLLWLLVFLKLALPPVLGAPWSPGNALARFAVPVENTFRAASREVGHHESAELLATTSEAQPLRETAAIALAAAPPARTAVFLLEPSVFLMIAWAVGTLGLFCALALQCRSYSRKVLRTSSPASDRLEEVLRAQCGMLGIRRSVSLCVSGAVGMPNVCGVRRPRILLPRNCEQAFSPSELAGIVAHELAHIKRGDLIVGWLTTLLCCFYWFHPAVWLAHRTLRREREMACDDMAVRLVKQEGRQYAMTILRATESFNGRLPLGAGLLGLLEVSDNLRRRIKSIGDGGRARTLGRRSAIALVAVVLLLPMGAWPALGAPPAHGGNDVERTASPAELPEPITTASVEPAPTESRVIDVPAKAPKGHEWFPTDITVSRGAELTFNAAGEVTWDPQLPSVPPDGAGRTPENSCSSPEQFLMPSGSCGGLIGKIGREGAPFFIGRTARVTARADGVLFLGINDRCSYFSDNKGSFRVTVSTGRTDTVRPAQAPSLTANQLETAVEAEIKAHYAKARPEVQHYVHWTATHFGGMGLWLPENAFDALSEEECERRVVACGKALEGEYGAQMCEALAAAGVLKDKRLVPAVLKVATYERGGGQDNRPKWMAVAALGRIGDERAVSELIPLVDHYNENTRMWARASLVRLTGQSFGADKQAWTNWWKTTGKNPPIDPAAAEPSSLPYTKLHSKTH